VLHHYTNSRPQGKTNNAGKYDPMIHNLQEGRPRACTLPQQTNNHLSYSSKPFGRGNIKGEQCF